MAALDLHILEVRGGTRVFAWGGGGAKCLATAARAENFTPAQSLSAGGGGGESASFFRLQNGIRVLSWPWPTAELTSKKPNHGGGGLTVGSIQWNIYYDMWWINLQLMSLIWDVWGQRSHLQCHVWPVTMATISNLTWFHLICMIGSLEWHVYHDMWG